MSHAGPARERGELEQLEERLLVDVPRGRDGSECVRLRFVRAKTAEGTVVAWHDLRLFYRAEDGSWKAQKKGISIRGRELHAVAVGFLRAVACSVPPELHASAKLIVAALVASRDQHTTAAPPQREPLPHEIYDLRRGREPR
jgi:hypothetical protein